MSHSSSTATADRLIHVPPRRVTPPDGHPAAPATRVLCHKPFKAPCSGIPGARCLEHQPGGGRKIYCQSLLGLTLLCQSLICFSASSLVRP